MARKMHDKAIRGAKMVDEKCKKDLARLAEDDTNVKVVLEYMANRERSPKEGTVDLLRAAKGLRDEGIEITSPELIDVFQGIAAKLDGRVIEKDGKNPVYKGPGDLKRISKEVLKTLGAEGKEQKGHKPAPIAPESKTTQGTKEVYLPLPGDRDVTITLPSDLTEEDIGLIVKVLRRIAQ